MQVILATKADNSALSTLRDIVEKMQAEEGGASKVNNNKIMLSMIYLSINFQFVKKLSIKRFLRILDRLQKK